MACHNFGPSIALALVGSHWTSAVVQRTFGAKYRPDDVYAGDLFSALGAIDSGVTCVLDWSHIHNTPEQTDAAIKALAESGVRAVFAYGNPQNETGRYWEMKGPISRGHCASAKTIVQSLQAAWKAMMKVKCPHCGEFHEMSVRETYINGALQDAVGRFAGPVRAH